MLLSGDHEAAVKTAAAWVGITEWQAAQSLQDKQQWVRAARRTHTVLMAGDGINDALALAEADASVSFSGASNLTRRSSDFILTGEDAGQLHWLHVLARRARTVTLQNYAWALAYNLLALPLAVLGYLAPWMAAIGMPLSSLIVVLNARRMSAPVTR